MTPTVTATGTSPIAQGSSSTLTASIPEAGPWTVGWAHLADPQNIVNGSASHTVTPAGTTTYTLSTVNGCSGTYPSVSVAVTPPAPQTLIATAASSTTVNLAWTIGASADVDQYRVERCMSACASGSAVWSSVSTTALTSFTDATALANKSYVYRIRSIKSGTESAPSPSDFATTVIFTDDPVVAGVTVVEDAHLVELRTAADALRAAAGLAPFSYADAVTAGLMIESSHINELRTAINAARAQLGFLPVTFTDSALAAGVMIKAAHWNELRGGVR